MFPVMAAFIRLLHDGKSMPKGLTPQQTKIIMSIYRSCKSVRVSDLATRNAVTQGTMTVALQKLQRRGLIVREKDPEDKRASRISLSRKGKTLAEETHRRMIRVCEAICTEISHEERTRLIGSLQFVAETLQGVLNRRDSHETLL